MHLCRHTLMILGVLWATSLASAQASSLCVSASDNTAYDNGVGMGTSVLLAIQLQAPTPLSVTRLEVWTGEQNGTNSLGIWSHDATRNLPAANLGTAQWNVGQVNGWQGAVLPSIQVPAGTFWLVWGPSPVGGQATVERAGTPAFPAPGAQFYRASRDGGQTWGQLYRDHLWKFRVRCGGRPGAYEVFGGNCRGVGAYRPILGFNDAPTLGQTMEVNLEGAPSSTPAVLAIGDSATSWLGLGLPLDLGPYGAPGCNLLCSALVTVAVQTTGGMAGLPLTLPTNPALVGAPIFNQWWVANPTASSLGLVFSNGGRGVIGN